MIFFPELNQKCQEHEKNLENVNLKFERIKVNINKGHDDNLKLENVRWEEKMAAKNTEISLLTSKVASRNSEFMGYKSEIDGNKREISILKDTITSNENEHHISKKGLNC